MARGRPVAPIQLNDEERTRLMSLANSRSLPHGLAQRAQIVLLLLTAKPTARLPGA